MKDLVNGDGKSSLDLASSYYRNAKQFKGSNYVAAHFAERYDGIVDSIPRSSYFPLFSDSQGLPIAFRVAHGLQAMFQSLTQKNEDSNLPRCREILRQAQYSVDRNDWLTGVGQVAQAFRLGTAIEKQKARVLLEQMAESARSYAHFAPALQKNVLYTQRGEVSVVGYLSDDDAKRYTMMINGSGNSQVTQLEESVNRVKVNRYPSARRSSVV